MSILVFGSINMDLVARVPQLPLPGETIQGSHFTTSPGGKGANQAVAVAKLGAEVALIGRVGEDGFGQELMGHLQRFGVDVGAIATDPHTSTGIAQILVDDRGQNQIAIVGGANHTIGNVELDQLKQRLPQAKILLLQLEIPLPMAIAAAQRAKAAGVTVILDPAPAPDTFPDELYSAVDILTPNETEASRLVGFLVTDQDSAAIATETLQNRGIDTVIITLGDRGSFCRTPTEAFFTPAIAVDVVDTVAAGDGFNGAIATALQNGQPWREAIHWATCAAGLCCTRSGAQFSLPNCQDVDEKASATSSKNR
ncbi:MAG: ribokinase [Cyanobacteria bacterium P01_C01_bin.89]